MRICAPRIPVSTTASVWMGSESTRVSVPTGSPGLIVRGVGIQIVQNKYKNEFDAEPTHIAILKDWFDSSWVK